MTTLTARQRISKIAGDWMPAILLLCLLLAARSTLADHYHVPTGSMEGALRFKWAKILSITAGSSIQAMILT